MDGRATTAYAECEKRFNDIVALRKPDRVPVVPMVAHYFPTKIRGVSKRDAGHDGGLRYQCMRDATLEFDWDFAPPNGVFASGLLEALGITQIKWPGGGLPDDSPFQFVEKEWMAEAEYDESLADPNGYTLSKMIPRIAASRLSIRSGGCG